MKYYILCVAVILSIKGWSQKSITTNNDDQTSIVSVWAFKPNKSIVNGLSIGVASISDNNKNKKVNGVNIEIIGVGILVPLIPKSPIVQNDSLLVDYRLKNKIQLINGLNLSGTGSVCDCMVNGISLGAIGQIAYKINGFSANIEMNFVQIHNGWQVAMFNETYRSVGLQTGLFNGSTALYGAQIGLVNNASNFRGLQIGLLNRTTSQIGLQIGLFNFTNKIKGLQIGFWNVNGKRSMPFLNF